MSTSRPAGSALLRRIIGLFSVGALGQLAGIAAGVAQAHTLGPEGKSVLAYAVIALSMVLIGTDGISNAVLMQAGRKRDSVARIHAAMTLVIGAAALPCFVIAVAIGSAFPSQRPLIGAAFAIPFALYVQGVRGLLLAMGATGQVAWQASISTVFFSLALLAGLIVWHISSYQALALWVAAQFAAAVYSAVVLRRRMGKESEAAHESSLADLVREQFRFGSRSSLATLAGYLNLRIDVFLISALLGARMLGIYTLAVATGELLWSISLPVVWAALESIAGNSFQDAAGLTARLMRGVMALQVTLGIVLFVAGPWLIAHVYGASFAAAGPVMRILLPGLVIYAVETFLGYFILVQIRRPLLLFAVQMTSAACCAIITLLTIGRFGIAGAALATTTTYIAVVAFKSYYFKRKTGIGIREQWIVKPADFAPLYRRLQRFAKSRSQTASENAIASG